jgi:hypothetical protein
MDEPGDFEEVNIDVVDVMYKQSDDDDDDNGWESLEAINTGVYNLLDLTGGINVILVDDFDIPAGELNQIRLVLGENNTLKLEGEEAEPLKTPSAQQSGLKIKVNETLEENISYTFLLDFNVEKSIVMAGNSGNTILKPVINASIEANSGALSGVVNPLDAELPLEFMIEVQAWIDGGLEPAASAYVNQDTGAFVIVGLNDVQPYDIKVVPAADSGYSEKTLENPVEVTIGTTTDLGTIDLDPTS